VRLVEATLDPKTGSLSRRRQRFARLREKFSRSMARSISSATLVLTK